jgi:hypothetical protein
MADSLQDLLSHLRGIEKHFAEATRLYEQARAEGSGGGMVAHIAVQADRYQAYGEEDYAAMFTMPGVDRLQTICIAADGEFTAAVLRKRCAAAALAAGKTLDEFLKLPVESGADLLHAALAPTALPPTAKPGEGEGNGNKGATQEPSLGERAQLVLKVLFDKAAFDSDHRERTEDVAVAAVGKSADANQFKEVIAELKRLHYLDTKEGRGGGCWLTATGKCRAEKL